MRHILFCVLGLAAGTWFYEPTSVGASVEHEALISEEESRLLGSLIQETESPVVVEETQPVMISVAPNPAQALERVLYRDMVRLGVENHDWIRASQRFLKFVKIVESEGNRYAQAQTSTAMSFYQFTIPSVPTAINRLQNYIKRHQLGYLPQWAIELKAHPKKLFELDEYRQTILAMVNIIEQRGSDTLLRRYLQGEKVAAKTLYYTYHHTDPDPATKKRVELVFAQVFAD